VRSFIETQAVNRFTPWDTPEERLVGNRAGFRKRSGKAWTYFVFPDVFRTEICNGLDPKLVARALADRRMLLPDAQGKFTRSERLPGLGNSRVYVLAPALFDDETEGA
jgi:uncharacterized protein (DUF927 family)